MTKGGIISLLAAALIVAATVWVVGVEETVDAIGRAGWIPFAAVGLLKLAFLTSQAAAWVALNRPINHNARFRTIFEAVVLGQAGNVVTPSTYLGGEPLKVIYLGRMARLPYDEVAGTVLLSKYLELLSFMVVLALSAAMAAWTYRGVLFSGPLLAVGTTLVGGAAALLCLSSTLCIALNRSWRPLTRLVAMLVRLFPNRAWTTRLTQCAARVEDQASRVFRNNGRASLAGFACMLAGHAAVFAYPLAFFCLLCQPLAPRADGRMCLSPGELALIFAACQFLLAVQVTPGGAGVLDGGLIGVFALIGLNRPGDIGASMAYLLCLRLWDVVVIIAGVLLAMRVGARILGGDGPRTAGEPAPRADERPAPRADDRPAPRAESDCFPYRFTPLVGLPRHLRFRVEGRPPRDTILRGLSYLLKYRRKLRTAPPEELTWFDRQRAMLEALTRRTPPAGSTSLAMIGDLMWLRNNWNGFLSDAVLDVLNRHEVVLGNLETVISPRFRVPTLLPDCPLLNSDPALVTSFRRPDGASTFTALAFANNHVFDYRDEGIEDVLEFLRGQGILCAGVRRGAQDRPYVTFNRGGIRFGFCAATWGVNFTRRAARSRFRISTVAGLTADGPADLSEIREILEAMAADGADFRIVALHWGFEHELYPSPRHMQAAREIVRAGADVIMGSHPHVIQPSEVCFVNGYEDRWQREGLPATPGEMEGCLLRDAPGRPRKALVIYSLGNFTTAMYTFMCRVGCIQSMHVARDPATDAVDWWLSPPTLVYNDPRDTATGRRRLVLLRDYLRGKEGNGALRPDVQKDLDLLLGRILPPCAAPVRE